MGRKWGRDYIRQAHNGGYSQPGKNYNVKEHGAGADPPNPLNPSLSQDVLRFSSATKGGGEVEKVNAAAFNLQSHACFADEKR